MLACALAPAAALTSTSATLHRPCIRHHRCAAAPIANEEEQSAPPPFSFLSDKPAKKKNAVDIENDKRAKYLNDKREFEKTKVDTSYQEDLEEFSLGTAARDAGNALSDGEIPPLLLPIGVVAIIAFIYVFATLILS